MRSGFTTTQLEAGVDLLAVANMTGHRTMASDVPPVLSSRQICSPVPPDRNVPWEKQSDESPLLADCGHQGTSQSWLASELFRVGKVITRSSRCKR